MTTHIPARRSLTPVWLLALCLACFVATPAVGGAGTDWSEVYRTAVANADLEDWPAVETGIRQVLKLKPAPDRTVRLYGMWHAAYMPYYYLGLAQYHLGHRNEALESFARAEAAGTVQHDPVAYLKMSMVKKEIQGGGPATAAPAAHAAPTAHAAHAPAVNMKAPPAAEGDDIFDGLQAFFQGNYDASIAAFQEALKRAKGDDLTLHLYLGMAYAGKASTAGKEGNLWRNQAELEFKRVHAIDPHYTLASGVFSQEMVDLFKQSGNKP